MINFNRFHWTSIYCCVRYVYFPFFKPFNIKFWLGWKLLFPCGKHVMPAAYIKSPGVTFIKIYNRRLISDAWANLLLLLHVTGSIYNNWDWAFRNCYWWCCWVPVTAGLSLIFLRYRRHILNVVTRIQHLVRTDSKDLNLDTIRISLF